MPLASGSFSRLYNWEADRNASVKIMAERMDAEMDGIAAAISRAIMRDGQSTVSADIPFNAQKITGLGNATAATDALNRQTADARYVSLDSVGELFSVGDYGAAGDAITLSNAVTTAGSNVVTCASAALTTADQGKRVWIDYAGASRNALCGILKYVSATSFSVWTDDTFSSAVNATYAVPHSFAGYMHWSAAGTGYAPGDTITIAGGTSSTTAVGTITATQVVSATVANGGSGGAISAGVTSGTVTVYGTNGDNPFQASVTLTAGVITAVGSISFGGLYTANPPSLTNEPVTMQNGTLTGAQLSVVMGIRAIYPSEQGAYSSTPANPAAQASTSGTGSGATITVSWRTSGIAAYGTDDTDAFASAINAANAAFTAGASSKVIIPPGLYIIGGTTLPTFNHGGQIYGAGNTRSMVMVAPSYSGDLFSWSDAWQSSNTALYLGDTPNLTMAKYAPAVVGLGITATRRTANTVHAFQFYDRTDQLLLDNVDVWNINGSALRFGYLRDFTQAYLRESVVSQIRVYNCGTSSYPAVDVNADGAAASSNQVDWDTVNIYGSQGVGLALRAASGATLGEFKFSKLRVEGKEWNPKNVQRDLIRIGDDVYTGQVNSVNMYGVELVNPYVGGSAMKLIGSANPPYLIQVAAMTIGTGNVASGHGLHIVNGRTSRFEIFGVNTYGAEVKLESTAGGELNFALGPSSSAWVWQVDCTATNLSTVMRMPGYPGKTTRQVVADVPDSTSFGGGTRGIHSVDLQTNRNFAAQIASGTGSSVLGGASNTASGAYAGVGGSGNTVTQNNSFAWGVQCNISALNAYAFGFGTGNTHTASVKVSGGMFSSVVGSRAAGVHSWAVSATGTSANRLTADGNSASTANVLNILTNSAFCVRIVAIANNLSTAGSSVSYEISGMLTRDSGSAAWAVLTAGATATRGTTAGSSFSAAADTTLNALNFSFTPPTGNADTWDVSACLTVTEAR